MKNIFRIALIVTAATLFESAYLTTRAAKPHAIRKSHFDQLRYQVLHIPLPKGYRIVSAQYTKYGAVAGEIQNGKPTTNTPDTYGPSFAFLWRNKRLQTFRVPKGYATAEAIDASADGQIVMGNAGLLNDGAWMWEDKRGVVWRNKIPMPLNPVSDMGGNTDAVVLRANGAVIGYSSTVEEPNLDFPRPVDKICQWAPPDYKPQLLDVSDTLPAHFYSEEIKGQDQDFRAFDANKYGAIVGTLSKDDGNRAMLLRAGKPLPDLNTCLSNSLPPGKFLVSAERIDNRGWIIALLGKPTDSNSYEAETVLLKPMK